MQHPLNNPIWSALNSGAAPFAFRREEALFIDRRMGFFAGLSRYTKENLDQLYSVMDTGMRVILFTPGLLELDVNWKVRNKNPLSQMVFEGPTIQVNTDSTIRELEEKDVPEMLALTQLAKPGPFLARTIDFGGYFGCFIQNRLVAMAGTRLVAGPFTEVSAVCTHPDFLGKGLAKKVIPYVLNYIQQRGQIPYLQLYPDNLPAYNLYLSLGFVERINLQVYSLEK